MELAYISGWTRSSQGTWAQLEPICFVMFSRTIKIIPGHPWPVGGAPCGPPGRLLDTESELKAFGMGRVGVLTPRPVFLKKLTKSVCVATRDLNLAQKSN